MAKKKKSLVNLRRFTVLEVLAVNPKLIRLNSESFVFNKVFILFGMVLGIPVGSKH